ncbi:DUF1707 SHOCT-like domain-containing protein [Corynebacterium senegalense]|uniref:DUF1707 SHOCT-like domain-containing protein n=1 Tax=Corynebacterium senegalense TaxID=2080750 RepID=UPI001FEA9D53|nr:DUF1707 domain-containing protein [Corynebacterium senegalense]
MDSQQGPHPDFRIGDSERMQALDRLTELFTAGYLDVAEFYARSATATSATRAGELDALFADVPRGRDLAVSQTDGSADSATDAELDRLVARGRKVRSADSLILAGALIFFFVGLLVFDWGWSWVVFPVAALAVAGVRGLVGLGDEEEELFEELDAAEKEKRAKRLRIAMERRKELEG